MGAGDLDPRVVLEEDRFVRGIARGLIRDSGRAEDAAQEAWLAACQTSGGGSESGRRRGGIGPWLTGVVKRVAWKGFREDSRRRVREAAAARAEAVPSAAEVLEREALRREIVEAVLALPEPYQATILLRYFEDLPPRLVASRLRVPVETVRTRLKRGLDLVRDRLRGGERAGRSGLAVGLSALAGPAFPAGSAIAQALALGAGWCSAGVLAMKSTTKIGLGGVALLIAGLGLWKLLPPGAPDDVRALRAPSTPAEVVSGPAAGGPAEAPTPATHGAGPVVVTAPYPGESAAVAPPALGTLVVTVVFERDRSPAAGMPVGFLIWNDPNPFLQERTIVTGETGVARLEGAAPGRVHVSPLLGGTKVGTIEAGKETALTLEIPRGATIEGVVVDERDAPVSGADIWLCEEHSFSEGLVVTRSGTNGTFRIRDVDASGWRWVGACSADRAPTKLVCCLGGPDSVHEVRLVFPGPGGRVAGVVTDGDGRPLRNAVVLTGPVEKDDGFGQSRGKGGENMMKPGPAKVRTDGEGRFRTLALPPGTWPLLARAPGFAAHRRTVEVRAGLETDVEIRLGRGGALAGTVSDAAGNPVPRLAVQIGGYGTIESSFCRTAADGSFLASGLVPGKVGVEVGNATHGSWKGDVEILEGATTDLRIRLDRGARIRGRLIDSKGAPLGGLEVMGETHGSKGSNFVHATSKPDGRFELPGCLLQTYEIRITEAGAGIYELATRRGVMPDGPEFDVVVEGAGAAPASVRGRVLDPDGRPLGTAQITPHRKGGSVAPIENVDGATGAFVLEKLPPGNYEIGVRCQGFPPWASGAFDLGPGEARDLGEIRMDRGSAVVIELEVEPGVELSSARMTIAYGHPRTTRERVEVTGPSLRLEGIPAGPAEVAVTGVGICDVQRTLEVPASAPGVLKLRLRRGVQVRFKIQDPPGERPPNLAWSLRAADGSEIASGKAYRRGEGQLVAQWGIGPGTYTVTATTATGLRAEKTFDVGFESGTTFDVEFGF